MTVYNIHMPKKTGEIYFQFFSLANKKENPPIKICDIEDNNKFTIELDSKYHNAITFHDEKAKIGMKLFIKNVEE